MKYINILVCLCGFIAVPVMATQVNIGSAGDLHFTININQGSCEFAQDNIDVEMGSVVLQKPVTIGRELNKKNFSIELENCENVQRAYVSLDGMADSTDPALFALDSDGAKGIAIKIVKDGGEQVFPISTNPTPIEYVIPSDGAFQLNYVASYVSVKSDATSGTANATVNFTVQYE